MAVTVVQSAFFVNSNSGSFTNPVTAGNTVFLAMSGYDTTDPFTITTSNPTVGGSAVTGSSQLIQEESGWDGSVQGYAAIWMLPNCAGGSAAVSLTYNGNLNGNVGLYAVEVAGLGPYPVLDQTAGNSGTSGATSSGATGQTIWSGEFVLAISNHDDGNPPDVPAGYTGAIQGSGTTVYGYQIASAAGSTYTWAPDSGGDGWAAVIVTVAPTLIQYNTGVAVSTEGATSVNFTVPDTGGINSTGVEVGDIMLATVSVFTEDSTQPTISLSGSGGSWSLVSMTDGSTNPQLSQSGAIYCYNFAYTKVATHTDIGSTVTMSETGSAAGTTWLGVAMAAYTGANPLNPIDRAGGATDNNVSDGVTCPSETARIAGDWAIYLCGGGFNFDATPTPPAGITQRQYSLNGGATGAAIADSNGATGLNTIGGGSYTNNGFGPAYLSAFTICLAPAGVYVVQSKTVSDAFSGSLTSNATPGGSVFVVTSTYSTTNGAVISTQNPTYNGSAVAGAQPLYAIQSPYNNTDGYSLYTDCWMLPNVPTASTAIAITATNGTTASNDGLFFYEVLGLGAAPVLDQSYSTQADSGNSITVSGKPIAYPSEFVIASSNAGDASSGSGPPGSPWTSTYISNYNCSTGYQVTDSSGGTYTWSLNQPSSIAPWCAGIATVTPSTIQYNTGTTASISGHTSINFTLPSTGGLNGTGVQVGDVMLLSFECFTEESSQPVINFSGGGGNWTLVPMTDGSTNPQATTVADGLYSYGYAYYRVATVADNGATITVTESGSPAGSTWMDVAMAAYTGANNENPIDRASGVNTIGSPVTLSCPSETARIAGDWAIYMCPCVPAAGATLTGPSGSTQRQSIVDVAGVGSAIYDSNGTTGMNTVGGGTFASNVFNEGWMEVFTICLAPPGIYVVQTYNSGTWSGNLTDNATPGNTLFMFPVAYDVPANTSSSSPQYNSGSVTGTTQLWSVQSNSGGADMYSTLWMLPNLPTAATEFGVTMSGGSGPSPLCANLLLEVLGLGPDPITDQSATAAGNNGNSSIGPTAATLYSNEIVLASGAIYGAYPSDGPGAPWTDLTDPTNQHAIVSWQTTSSSGETFSWSENGNGSPWAGGIATVAISNSTPYTPPASTSSGLTMIGIV